MRVLWIPHTPQHYLGWDGCRQYRLFEHLKKHCELHVVNWIQKKSLSGMRAWGSVAKQTDWYGTRYDISLAPNFHRLFLRRAYPPEPVLWLNQRLFRGAIRRLIADVRPDCCVVSITHQWTGYPPFEQMHPLVFDHVDRAMAKVEDRYVGESDALVGVSESLVSRHRHRKILTTVISNGVNLLQYRALDRTKAKAALGLEGRIVVSLIGLTCSDSLYFVDAVRRLQQSRGNICLVVVGGGSRLYAIRERARVLGIRNFVAPGHVSSTSVAAYFAASDVGLYPGDNTPWFLDAAPLKILEYSACGVPVVSSPVHMFRSGWPNVLITDPTADAFAEAIEQALSGAGAPPDLSSYDWSYIAMTFQSLLTEVSEGNWASEPGPTRTASPTPDATCRGHDAD